ncbi:CHASE2 domain-containing protein [Iningainema tapete]|uniref:non-specific serine/threonine protein kinase n=1 Tax=Iningainema tapete BLCC-T55 TaxID=2748662 RepID=A0A8J6XH44_9CYAN|nr:CHASE2 domain-containing protein [Iningainema tapete]MBD2772452.1 CHASE2 domain-containing protein [Iningainema tapete BLCC-T55]
MLKILQEGRYKVISALAEGGFGQIYLAEDTHRPGNPKCIVKHLKLASQDLTFLQVARRLFNSEAKTLEKLGRHELIPQLLAYFEENQEFYLVQEYIEGHSLSEELADGKKLSEVQVIALLQDVLGILEFVHTSNVIHRDIKPSNLIRRQKDGKIVLIDFGAVKEIHTQLAISSGQTDLTIVVGTQGYMPNEQSAGKPRFNSDIYALGIVAIQALTGLKSSQLREDPNTFEIIWRNQAQVSAKLADIIDKMVRYDFRQRYQSATEVLQALQKLTDAPICEQRRDFPIRIGISLKILGVGWIAATSLILGVRSLGWFQPLELAAQDRMMRMRYATQIYSAASYDDNAIRAKNHRLLVVEITPEDIKQKNDRLSVRSLNQLLSKLQSYQPSVIGLNIDQPHLNNFPTDIDSKDNIIAVCTSSQGDREIPPPIPINNIGFDNLIPDTDGMVRRSLLFTTLNKDKECDTSYSFAFLLAINYLQKQGINYNYIPGRYFRLGKTIFSPLQSNSGTYQIRLDYRAAADTPKVSLNEVLTDRINPELVKDRIVIIGSTATNSSDGFYTPYSDRKISSTLIHAQVVSQILDTVLNNRPLFWFWSKWAEIIWIGVWGIVGFILVWRIRNPLILGLRGIAMLGVLFVTVFISFTQVGAVIPLAAPALALVVTGALVFASRAFAQQPPTIRDSTPVPLIPLLPTELNSVPDDKTLPPVSYLSGATISTIQGDIAVNEVRRYVLKCNQGQQLTMEVLFGSVNLTVVDPDGTTVATTIHQSMKRQGLLSKGEYTIEIAALEQSTYTISVDVLSS